MFTFFVLVAIFGLAIAEVESESPVPCTVSLVAKLQTLFQKQEKQEKG